MQNSDKKMLEHTLTYHHDSALLFECIAHEPWAMFLDSGCIVDAKTGESGSRYGRYDILVARPIATLVVNGKQTTVTEQDESTVSEEDPFLLLKHLLAQYQAPKIDLPFAGGAMGYFAYDLGHQLEGLAQNKAEQNEPEMMVGIYDWAIIVDHRLQRTSLVSYGFSDVIQSNWLDLCAFFEQKAEKRTADFAVKSSIESNFTPSTYTSAFNQIKAYIKDGDFYQVNLAQRFAAMVEGDAWQAYKKLREISPAPFMAFMQLPLDGKSNFQVLSNSPERFIQVIDNHVETRPIKGTRPRSDNAEEDLMYSNELLASDKDKAENVMIVDLLRNDISKNCEIGSVNVEKLFHLQSFANVHHLVSIVTGQLKSNRTALDLLKGCFPGGSITGAPKIRAMQVINQLEPHKRGIYCGSIGYIGFDGQLDTNIAIRTAVVKQNLITFYAGGGIVVDSVCVKEYEETLDKAASMMKILKHFMR